MSPILSSAPMLTAGINKNLLWRYGSLGGEPVCTENLKAFKQMLPCKTTGLSTLLNPKELYSSNYHSISIHLSRSTDMEWQFMLAANIVKDFNLQTRIKDWSFTRDLGSSLMSTCPIANSSRVVVETTGNKFSLEPPTNYSISLNERVFSFYNTTEFTIKSNFNLRANYLDNKLELDSYSPSLFSIHTYLQSTDQQGGRISSIINNLDLTERTATFTHMIPFYLRIYLHTLKFVCNGIEPKIFDQHIILGIDRKRPLLIELKILLPSNSICEITYEYEAALTEYPPDSNYGLFVPGPILNIIMDGFTYAKNATIFGSLYSLSFSELKKQENFTEKVVTLYGEALLVLIPVPDFSMPFNVICFVCTAIALFYGPAHALTTKIMTPIIDERLVVESGLIRRLIAYLRKKIRAKFEKAKKE